MMNWLKTLTVKPWIAEQAEPHGETRLVVQGQDASKLTAFKFCLAVVTVIFFLFTITFIQRTQSFDFQPLAGEAWLPFTDTSLLWRSTILLALASLALQLAIWQARKDQVNRLMLSLLFANLLAFAFLISQLHIWQYLEVTGFGLTLNPANSYFYLFTLMHGLHLMIGLYVLLTVTFRAVLRQAQELINLRLATMYFHFMLGIWLFLFALVTQDAATFKLIASICGF